MTENVWFYKKDQNVEYYTPFTDYRVDYKYLHEGDNNLTSPKEKVDFLNSLVGKCDYEREGVFRVSSKVPTVPAIVLPAGVYRYCEDAYSPIELPERLEPRTLRDDSYIHLGGTFAKIEKDISKFLSNREFYEKRKFMFKLGILLYGSPGNGKSLFVRKIIEKLVPEDSVTIFIPGRMPDAGFLDRIRKSLKDRLKVFVFEELAAATDENKKVELLLDFLDGENSVGNSIILATTNYPEKIPRNVIDRAQRFDKVYEIGNPKGEELKSLLKFFLDREATESELKSADGLSISDLKEIAFLVHLREESFELAVKELKRRHLLCKKEFANATQVGFGQD